MLTLWKKLKAFYNRSAENRMQIINLFAFLIMPMLGMAILYIVVRVFFLK
jgi:hypothetical protein